MICSTLTVFYGDIYQTDTHRVGDSHMNKAVHYSWAQLVHDLYHGFVIILEGNTTSYLKTLSHSLRGLIDCV